MEKHDVFISYSRKDITIIEPVLESLRNRGYSIWIDTEGRYHSEKFRGTIVKAIKSSECVVFFSSKNSNDSEWVRREINVADEENKPIIPFIIDNSGYDDEIRLTLTGIERIDASESSFDDCINKLEETIGRIVNRMKKTDVMTPMSINKLRKIILGMSMVIGCFMAVYAVCFGIGYVVEIFSESPHQDPQVELNLHITFRNDVIIYSNHGLTAEYFVPKDSISINKDATYYSVSSEDLWRAASISAGFTIWTKSIKHMRGNGKMQLGIAVASFFGTLFGYSQGQYVGRLHNMKQTQETMENYLQDPDSWIYLKRSYLKRGLAQ